MFVLHVARPPALPAVAVLVLRGDLRSDALPDLELRLRQLEQEAETLLVDLRLADYASSAVLHALARAQRRARSAGRRFAVVRPRGELQKMLVLTGAHKSLDLVDVPEQLAELRSPDASVAVSE